MIVLDDSYTFLSQSTIQFQYDISIPTGVEYNKVSYSQHAMYFSLDTEDGLYPTQTGSAKLGFMIAKQYNLEIEKYQKDSNKKIQGITFTLTEEGSDTSTIKVTNIEGKITIPRLFAERVYILKEQKTIDDYALNDEEIRFYTYTTTDESGSDKLNIVYINEDGSYSKVEEKYTSIKNVTVKSPPQNDDYSINFEIEDEVKAKVIINKIDSDTGGILKNVKFKLFNKEDLQKIEELGLSIDSGNIDKYITDLGQIYTTDKNGQINISGIYLDEEYAIREIKSTGYYIPQTAIKFKIRNNNGEFVLDYTDNGSTLSKEVIKNDEIPTINLNLKNDKIPTYSLKLNKYAKGEKVTDGAGVEKDKTLEYAQYRIYGDGITEEGQIYTTDENGTFTIDGLYEYVEGKYITGEYRLVEIYAPEGYSVNPLELKFKAYRDEYGKLQMQILEGLDVIRNLITTQTDNETGEIVETSNKDINIINSESKNSIINIGVEDYPIFSLQKKDIETKEPIAGAKFIISDLDGKPVTGMDGEIVGDYIDTTPIKLPPPELNFTSTSDRKWIETSDGLWKTESIEKAIPPEITFTSNTTHKWTQKTDGTWESGNKGTNNRNTTSTLTSNNFEILQDSRLTFDWTVSSRDSLIYKDYAYYTIKNVDTGATVRESEKICGTSYGTNYNSLSYINESMDLPAGKYKIEFSYERGGGLLPGTAGLDAAFVKNVKLESKWMSDNSISTLTSNEFKILQDSKLTFDWTVSSRNTSSNKDYAYYTITNIDTGSIVKNTGESKTRICGLEYGTDYDSLSYTRKSIDLPAGTYKIEFSYKRTGGELDATEAGLDSAFVKNIILETKEPTTTGYAYVITDENGNITANLREGFYKVIEIEAPEGYELPESEDERTSYFGIGSSRSASGDTVNPISGKWWNYINCVASTQNGGVIACGTFSKYNIGRESGLEDGIDVNGDGKIDKISNGRDNGIIISYDMNGKYSWSKSFGGEENDSLNKIIQTSDGGFAAVGYVSSKIVKLDDQELPSLSINSDDTTLSEKDAVLLKLDSKGNYQWGVRIGGTGNEEIKSIIETEEGNLIIVGCYDSNMFNFYDMNSKEPKNPITVDKNKKEAFISSYSLQTGENQWSQKIGNSTAEVNDIVQYTDGLLVAVENVIKGYNFDGTYNNVTATIGNKITSLDVSLDDSIIAGVNYDESDKRWDAGIYKITIEGTNVTKNKIYSLSGNYDDYVSDVKVTSDGGVLFGGWYYSNTIEGENLNPEELKNADVTNPNGYVIKLDSENNVESSNIFYGDKYNIITTVSEKKDGNIILGGSFTSSILNATNINIVRDEENDEENIPNDFLLNNAGNSDGFVVIFGYHEAKVPQLQQLEIFNQLKKQKITTNVRKSIVDGTEVIGGTITGSYQTNSPELVSYGRDSVQKIQIIPDSNYIVKSLEINGKKVKGLTTENSDNMGEEMIEKDYIINEDGSITLDIFRNVKEDINIVVEFSNSISSVEINHYLWTSKDGATTTKIVESEQYSDEVGKKYSTSPRTDTDYEIITNFDYYSKLENLEELYEQNGVTNITDLLLKLKLDANDYYIPSNSTGVYTKNKAEIVNYYYKEKTYSVTVHHYIEGTNTPVPLKDSENNEGIPDEILEGYKKESEYETSQAPEDKIDYRVYELVSVPENAKGIIEENIEITYYYRIKKCDLDIVAVAKEDNSIRLENTKFNLYKLVCTEHTKEYHDNELIDYNSESSCWEKVGEYTTSNSGEINITDLEIVNEFRLIETEPALERSNVNIQWKIEFGYGQFAETDENVLKLGDKIVRVTTIGDNTEVKTENEKILIENAKLYDMPITGGKGNVTYYIFGCILSILSLLILIIIKYSKK